MKRRQFLKSSALMATSLAAVSMGAGGVAAGAATPSNGMDGDSAKRGHGGRGIERIGIQLYTVREQMAADSAGTLAALAEIGYDEVELAGFHGHSPAAMRRMLDDAGLAAPSGHVSLDAVRSHGAEIIEAAQRIGMGYIVLGWLAPEDRASMDQFRRHAELFNRFGERCRSAGIQFGYHNHDFEFENLDGQRPVDLLLTETDADLMKMELDLYWIRFAGDDPFAFFERYPGRTALCHVKDMAADRSMADVGAGTTDFGAIFAAREQAGLEHYFVERDDAPDPLGTATASYAALRRLEI